MARLPRLILPDMPYHVTQRGNRRLQTFFEGADYELYRDLLGEAAARAATEIWCYCLMPNHVHVVAVPSDEDGLRRTFAEAHRRYTGFINARNRWTGHLWQGRFGAVVMDDLHLAHAIRYVSLNPVRARLVNRAEDWRWSSVSAHLAGETDGLVNVAPALDRYGRFADFLYEPSDQDAWRALRMAETSGRPVGSAAWVSSLEARTGRTLAPQKRGPKTESFVHLVNCHRNSDPSLARDLMSPGSYQHLVEGTNLAPASYGKAVERLTARYVQADPELSQILSYQSRPFVSTPDFLGHEGYNLRTLDITTEAGVASHLARPYGAYTDYVTHPGLPSNLVFPR